MTKGRHHLRSASRVEGYLLIEVIIVISLLTAFGLLMAPLFAHTMRLSRQTAAAHSSLNQLDTVVSRLRQDAWHATGMAVPDGRTLKLQLPDGSAISWTVGENGDLSRTVAGAPTPEPPSIWSRWPYRMSFAASGPIVTLDVSAADSTMPAHFLLTSQVLLSRRMQP